MFDAGAPASVAVIRLYGWKYDPFGPAGFRPMRSKRERMKSAVARFSSVSVSRPRIESPATKKRSARRSSWRIDSFCGARGCAHETHTHETHEMIETHKMIVFLFFVACETSCVSCFMKPRRGGL